MYKGRKIIAIIPARKGSKRLPGKNIRKFCGKPLIAYAIDQARESRHIDEVVVSTDCEEIARLSRAYGASVPFMRPAPLASDKAKTADAVFHAVEWLRKKGESYDIVVVLQPTSPLRISSDIDSAIELIFKKRASSIVSVCPTELKPSWISAIPAGGSMKEFLWRTKNAGGSRSPSPVFRLNGALYVVQSKTLKSGGFYGNRPYAFVMPRERSVDIDDEFDFRFAEFLAKNRKKR